MKYVMTEAVAPEGMALLDQSEKVYVAHDAKDVYKRQTFTPATASHFLSSLLYTKPFTFSGICPWS